MTAEVAACEADSKDKAQYEKIKAYMEQYPNIDSLEAHIKSDMFWNSIGIAEKLADANK